jgi:hypothetical protein
LKCELHGNCATEFVGGEDYALTKEEMDKVVALYELMINAVNRDRDESERENQRKIMSEELKQMVDSGIPMKDCHIADTPVGRDYFKFALKEFNNIMNVVDLVSMIAREADDRNKALFEAAKAQRN